MAPHPTWGITATVDEPLPLLAAFVAHHLALGAARILLYLDQDAAEVEAFFAPEPLVTLIRTDTAYWERKGEQPQVHVRRQLFNGMDAYARADVDWLLHCDGDEFLHLSGDFGAELAALGPEVQSLHIPNSERVWLQGAARRHIFDGMERVPARGDLRAVEAIFGADMRYLHRGLLGYPNGKAVARTGQGLFMGIHGTKLLGPDGWADHASTVRTAESRVARLVHFDGLTPLHWQVKLLRKARDARSDSILRKRVGAARFAQIEEVQRRAGDPGAVVALHDRLRVLSAGQAEGLRAAGLLRDMPVDPALAVAGRYPGAHLDLGSDAFDVWLAARQPDLVAALRQQGPA